MIPEEKLGVVPEPFKNLARGSKHAQNAPIKVGAKVTVYIADELYKNSPLRPFECEVIHANPAHHHYTVRTPFGFCEDFQWGTAS